MHQRSSKFRQNKNISVRHIHFTLFTLGKFKFRMREIHALPSSSPAFMQYLPPRSLFRGDLWRLLMKTTDCRSRRKPNRPPSEVTNSHSLATSLPLSVYSVATVAIPCHRFTSTTTNRSKCKVEKVLANALTSDTNKHFVESDRKPLVE